MTTLSGWCTGPPGATHTAAQHQTCTQRMADGLLAGCARPDRDDETKEAS